MRPLAHALEARPPPQRLTVSGSDEASHSSVSTCPTAWSAASLTAHGRRRRVSTRAIALTAAWSLWSVRSHEPSRLRATPLHRRSDTPQRGANATPGERPRQRRPDPTRRPRHEDPPSRQPHVCSEPDRLRAEARAGGARAGLTGFDDQIGERNRGAAATLLSYSSTGDVHREPTPRLTLDPQQLP